MAAALACGGAAAALHLAADGLAGAGLERRLRQKLIALDLLEAGPADENSAVFDAAGGSPSALEALAAAWPAWLGPAPVRVLSEAELRARGEARNLATHGRRRLSPAGNGNGNGKGVS